MRQESSCKKNYKADDDDLPMFEALCREICKRRIEHGISFKQLARETGLSLSTITKLLSKTAGSRTVGHMSLFNLLKLLPDVCISFGADTVDLFNNNKTTKEFETIMTKAGKWNVGHWTVVRSTRTADYNELGDGLAELDINIDGNIVKYTIPKQSSDGCAMLQERFRGMFNKLESAQAILWTISARMIPSLRNEAAYDTTQAQAAQEGTATQPPPKPVWSKPEDTQSAEVAQATEEHSQVPPVEQKSQYVPTISLDGDAPEFFRAFCEDPSHRNKVVTVEAIARTYYRAHGRDTMPVKNLAGFSRILRVWADSMQNTWKLIPIRVSSGRGDKCGYIITER